jgi:hypothetical protein
MAIFLCLVGMLLVNLKLFNRSMSDDGIDVGVVIGVAVVAAAVNVPFLLLAC